MQDHYQARVVLKCRFPITVNDIMLSKPRMMMTGLQYLLFRKGPLTIAAAQAGLFARTRKELATPDVQYATVIFSADRPAEGLHKFSGFSLVAYQLRPESRGELNLKTANPADPPAIHPNYLATETDRRTIIDSLKLSRRLLATPDMQHFITSEYIPGEQVQDRRRAAGVCQTIWRHRFPSDQHVQDGDRPDGGGRPAAQCLWAARAARGRRIDHAGGGFGQYQRGDDHDR